MNYRTIALVGQPNCGKSTLFNVLSDVKTGTSNFAGTTVRISQSLIEYNGITYRLVDLPGVYSLTPSDGAEEVTVNYLLSGEVDLIINVLNASQLARGLELNVELSELNIPTIVALNMIDDAEKTGVKIQTEELSHLLGIPVFETISLYGKGIRKLIGEASNRLESLDLPYLKKQIYTAHIEKRLELLQKFIKDNSSEIPLSTRFYATKALEFPRILPDELQLTIYNIIEAVTEEIIQSHGTDPAETLAYERHHISMKITEKVSKNIHRHKLTTTDKLDSWLLTPFTGRLILVFFFLIYFAVIFYVGDLLSGLIEKPLNLLSESYSGLKDISPFLWSSVDGIMMGVSGALGIVLPYLLPLVFMTAAFEESGYLARIAFLIDGIMHKIGLHGKSVVPFILGFGCTVPAIYAARILEDKRERALTAVLLPFVPCSARISVIFALTAAFTGPFAAFLIFIYVLVVIGAAGKLLSRYLHKPTGFILEIPVLRLPSVKVSFRKTWYRIREFFKQVFLLLVGGSLILSWLDYFDFSKIVNYIFAPLVNFVLGLPDELGTTLVFGFLRKELVLVMATQAMGVDSLAALPLTFVQVMVFIIFVTFYFPCLSTFLVLKREFGWRIVLISSGISLVVSIFSGVLARLVLGFFNF